MEGKIILNIWRKTMIPYDSDLENEIWEDIPDIPNYQISNEGRVKFFPTS